jgi:hypothetical protein
MGKSTGKENRNLLMATLMKEISVRINSTEKANTHGTTVPAISGISYKGSDKARANGFQTRRIIK